MPGEFIVDIVGSIIEEIGRGFLELGGSKDTFKRKLYWTSFIILNIVVFVSHLIFKWSITITDGLFLFFISSLLSFFIITLCWGIWRFIKDFKKCKI